jgi:uncharacterized protein YkwD
MSLLVLAIAGPGIAAAQTGLAPVSYTEVISPSVKVAASGLDAGLLAMANQTRAGEMLSVLEGHDALASVAKAHARDMAMRGHVSDTNAMGASLFDQVRIADRRDLIGSFASGIAVLDAGATAADVHAAIQSDAANAENLRRGFTHAGIGTHIEDGRLYVVQIFARIDGELDEPLPMQLTAAAVLHPALASDGMTTVGWSISDASGQTLAQGGGRRLQSCGDQPVEGYLNLDVSLGTGIYTLRGPYVQVN